MFLGFNKSLLGITTKTPHHILLIDDNTKLRSILARYILLSCSERQHSCTLYQLSETGEPILTYSHDPFAETDTIPEPTIPDPNSNIDFNQISKLNPLESDFVIYEAAFPRQAVAWLNRLQASKRPDKTSLPKRLTVISDVMMPGDTQVGLGGLLTTIAQKQLPVNLLFMSSEAENYSLAQTLVGGGRPYFLVKGSANFNRLPHALVTGADRFTYQLLPRQTYPNLSSTKAA